MLDECCLNFVSGRIFKAFCVPDIFALDANSIFFGMTMNRKFMKKIGQRQHLCKDLMTGILQKIVSEWFLSSGLGLLSTEFTC